MKRWTLFIAICTLSVAMSSTRSLAASAFPPMAGGPQQAMTTSTGIELVWIPPGEFMMGSTSAEKAWAVANGGSPDYVKVEGEKPQSVHIAKGFWMGRTVVTVGQFRQFVDGASFVTEAERKGSAFGPVGSDKLAPISWRTAEGINWKDPKLGVNLKPNHPVCCVSWSDAMAYCVWLTETEKRAGKLPKDMVYRLPTEAEWEYACRGGRKGTRFWWGDKLEAGEGRLNSRGATDGFVTISPVDHFRSRGRNGFGLADMAGNVWQWCLDGYDPAGAHAEPYKGENAKHVYRGGSFQHEVAYTRCAARPGFGPTPNSSNGFRICCGVPR